MTPAAWLTLLMVGVGVTCYALGRVHQIRLDDRLAERLTEHLQPPLSPALERWFEARG